MRRAARALTITLLAVALAAVAHSAERSEAHAGLYAGVDLGARVPVGGDMDLVLDPGFMFNAHAGWEIWLADIVALGVEAHGGVAPMPIPALDDTVALWRIGAGVRAAFDLEPFIGFKLLPYTYFRVGYAEGSVDVDLGLLGTVGFSAGGFSGEWGVGAMFQLIDMLRLGAGIGVGFLIDDGSNEWIDILFRAEFTLPE